MALKHVVLSVVADTLAHGYELHAEVSAAFPVARPCDTSRVYGILVGLERAGLVRSCHEPAGRGRTRKCYRLSPAGAAELREWLADPRPGGTLLRRGLMVRLAFRGESVPWLRVGRGVPADWRSDIERRVLQRDHLLRPEEGETRIGRWVRLRSAAHIDAELRVLRSLDRA